MAVILQPVKTAEGLITNPADTVSGIATRIVDHGARRVLEKKSWKVEDSIQDRLLKRLEP